MHWRINRIQYPVYNLGPGKRLAIWVQGCSLGCPHCINPELWNSHDGRLVDVASLALGIANIAGTVDGITITGGEPFGQYEALVAFCTFLKSKCKTNIFVYSGYNLQKLYEMFPDKLFCKCIDMLMDGPYVEDQNQKESFRGSSNQKFYKFDAAGTAIESFPDFQSKKWSVFLSDDQQVYMAGIPGKDAMNMLHDHLKACGIQFEF